MIGVLGFGAQGRRRILKRLLQLPWEVKFAPVLPGSGLGAISKFTGLIISGALYPSVYKEEPDFDPRVFDLDIPILGICFGYQLMAWYLGGEVVGANGDQGVVPVYIDEPVGVLEGCPQREYVWISHRDMVSRVPKDFEPLAHTASCEIAAMRHRSRPLYGVIWHPEDERTARGLEVFRNFVRIVGG